MLRQARANQENRHRRKKVRMMILEKKAETPATVANEWMGIILQDFQQARAAMLAVEGISSMSVMVSELNAFVNTNEKMSGKLNKTLQKEEAPRAEIKETLVEANNSLGEFQKSITMAESVIKSMKPKSLKNKKNGSITAPSEKGSNID